MITDTHQDGSGCFCCSKSTTCPLLLSPALLRYTVCVCVCTVLYVELSLRSPTVYRTFSRIKRIFYPRFRGGVPSDSVSTGVVFVTCQILGKSTKDSSYQLTGSSSSLRTGVSLKGLMDKQNALFRRKRK